MNCTTIEQSKKLLELGLSPDSADILILNNVGRSGKVDDTNYTIILKENLNPLAKVPEIIPCWSVGALLEIIPQYRVVDKNPSCTEFSVWSVEYDYECFGVTLLDACYNMVCWLLENHYINKL